MQEEQILCACSAYEQKYYLNPRYASLPSAIQDELQIMAVPDLVRLTLCIPLDILYWNKILI